MPSLAIFSFSSVWPKVRSSTSFALRRVISSEATLPPPAIALPNVSSERKPPVSALSSATPGVRPVNAPIKLAFSIRSSVALSAFRCALLWATLLSSPPPNWAIWAATSGLFLINWPILPKKEDDSFGSTVVVEAEGFGVTAFFSSTSGTSKFFLISSVITTEGLSSFSLIGGRVGISFSMSLSWFTWSSSEPKPRIIFSLSLSVILPPMSLR